MILLLKGIALPAMATTIHIYLSVPNMSLSMMVLNEVSVSARLSIEQMIEKVTPFAKKWVNHEKPHPMLLISFSDDREQVMRLNMEFEELKPLALDFLEGESAGRSPPTRAPCQPRIEADCAFSWPASCGRARS